LEFEYIVKFSIEAAGPDVCGIRSIYQLNGDAHLICVRIPAIVINHSGGS
jgi:hypothetical protein